MTRTTASPACTPRRRANPGLPTSTPGTIRVRRRSSRVRCRNPTFPDLRYQRRASTNARAAPTRRSPTSSARSPSTRTASRPALLAVCLAQKSDRDRSVAALGEALALGLEAPEWVTPDVARSGPGSSGAGCRGPRPANRLRRPAVTARRHRSWKRWPASTRATWRAPSNRSPVGRGAARLRRPALPARGAAARGRAIRRRPPAPARRAQLNSRYLEARMLAARTVEAGMPRPRKSRWWRRSSIMNSIPTCGSGSGRALPRRRPGGRGRAARTRGRVEPQFARAQRLLGLVYHALGRHDDALRAVRRGLAGGARRRAAPPSPSCCTNSAT